jgi:REP element-mobilizing transposase RayT/DNA-binding response OmpR family regulator
MAINILLYTDNETVKDQCRATLTESAGYAIHACGDFMQAIHTARDYQIALTLLDADVEDDSIRLLEIGSALRQLHRTMHLVVLHQPNYTPEVGSLAPRAYLQHPFDMQAFLKVLNQLFPSSHIEPTQSLMITGKLVFGEPPWLQDVTRAAQHLARLTMQTSAQAALIVREEKVWAYAGQLSQEAAQEASETIQRSWNREDKSDLLRFARLKSTQSEHMLYATQLAPSMILALIFEGETSFSTIRQQAGQLARSLANAPEETGIFLPPAPPVAIAPPEKPAPARRMEDLEQVSEEELQNLPPISEILGLIPPPNPREAKPEPIGLTWEMQTETETEKPPAPSPSIETSAAQPRRPQPAPHVRRSASEEAPAIQRAPLGIEAQPAPVAENEQPAPEAEADIPDLAETRKQIIEPEEDELYLPESLIPTIAQASSETGSHRIVLEPASPAMYHLKYACLLMPRFTHHFLTGELAERLSEWLGQTCIAFGWRLEHLSIRPEYMQWIVSVPPATSPGHLMRIVRQQTSKLIFDEFNRLKRENPSGDFWAPGYLIMGGAQPHPPKLVKDFIRSTREKQGISRHPNRK